MYISSVMNPPMQRRHSLIGKNTIFSKMRNFLLNILFAGILCVVSTEGLKCYHCIYVVTDYHHEDIRVEDSCASGKTPLSRLSFDCSTLEYRILPNMSKAGFGIGLPNNEHHINDSIARKKPHPNAVFTCVTLTNKGRYGSYYGKYPVDGVFRGCLMSFYNWTIGPQCHEGKLKNLIANVKDEEISDLLVDFSDELDENVTDTGIFTCNQNNCNVQSTAGSDSSKMVPWNTLVYILVICFGLYRNV